MERRETSTKVFLADVFDPGIIQRVVTDFAQSRKVFSRVPCEVSHFMLGSDMQETAIPQRTNIIEEANLGSRVDDAVHPSLVVALMDRDRREEASLAGSRPPSRHRSACD